MATLQNVQESLGAGLTEQQITEQQISDLAVAGGTEVTTKWTIFKLVKTKGRGRVHIDGRDDVINPKTGKLERIHLLNGVASIWQSDLTEILKDQDFVRQNRRSLMFEDKILRIPDWDTLALEFARATRHNIGSPKRRTGSHTEFFEYDPKKQQEEALNKEFLEIEMAVLVKEMEEGKMKKLAAFFGVSFNDDLGIPKAPDGIRRELMIIAKREPERFQKLVDAKEVEISYLIKKAVIDSKIDLGGKDGNASWASNGGFIAKIPSGKAAIPYLVELAMTNSKEGKTFLEQLNTHIK